MEASSLPYHEPSIVQVLTLSSFGLLLNLTNWALERTIYCGLVGQILIGVFWGTPLGDWLDSSIEAAVVQLGYLGLILLVVAALGTSTSSDSGGSSISGATIGRPVGASLGLLLFVILACRWLVAPLHRHRHRSLRPGPTPTPTPANPPAEAARPALSAANRAFTIHTALLLTLVTTASYAGTSVLLAAFLAGAAITWSDNLSPTTTTTTTTAWTGARIYEHYYAPITTRLLTPFFFASIGFSIPITQLFAGSTVWRGIVYAALMALGKLLTGVWLLRFRVPGPKSLYPPSILGLAMIARGEIGFLIASVAEARGIFSPAPGGAEGSSELYLVVIWATVVCTVLGPVCVGLLVRRVKALERERTVDRQTYS
ncbi:hypothetical protein P167DRAFT_554126 [Morchella conica CCBAS932]|uniref:Cation/H+ exchanger transmembrane domain-containing protein n=1 Tax=Morchella conica CCBAS932 TaxID=1392247 RepID=A0A3N4KPL3_9PEZI|nr:hypothetical protein P167DRAFT_554126 [Morchella conica CCBAS932]